jgi:hypothetical protein
VVCDPLREFLTFNPKPKTYRNMSTPIAGTDSTLFEAYLEDKITSGRSVSVYVASPYGSANVYGSMTQCPEGDYLVRSSDGMSRCLFRLKDIRYMGDFCIFLNA